MQNNQKVIALAGNPNVGKSTVFNALTGLKQHTGNWAGKTVAVAQGESTYYGEKITIVDLPGTYSLYAHSSEEEVAKEYIESDLYDLVVVVCDATCLERNLNLVLQIQEITDRVVVCINLLDEAQKKQIRVNLKLLEKELKTPVVGIVARNKTGIYSLMDKCCSMMDLEKPPWYQVKAQSYRGEDCSFMEKAKRITERTVKFDNPDYQNRDRKLDQILTNKWSGFPIMLLLLLGVFWLTMVGSNYPSSLLAKGFDYIRLKLDVWFLLLEMPTWIHGLLLDGIYKVVAWVVSVMLPPMAIFFPLFTLLEDFGYLPRIAFNLDHKFQKACACGKQSLTMRIVFSRMRI